MRFSKLLILSLLFMLSFGCSQSDIPTYEYTANQITKQTAYQLKKDKGLLTVGNSGGMMGDIRIMGMDFDYFQEVTIQEARKLIVYAIQTYLKNINNNKEIRPYLHTYPFNIKNIDIDIWICQSDGTSPPQENIELITLVQGMLLYKLTKFDKSTKRPILLEETYEEALKELDAGSF